MTLTIVYAPAGAPKSVLSPVRDGTSLRRCLQCEFLDLGSIPPWDGDDPVGVCLLRPPPKGEEVSIDDVCDEWTPRR